MFFFFFVSFFIKFDGSLGRRWW